MAPPLRDVKTTTIFFETKDRANVFVKMPATSSIIHQSNYVGSCQHSMENMGHPSMCFCNAKQRRRGDRSLMRAKRASTQGGTPSIIEMRGQK
jgi:hypothetical protein